MPSVSKAILFGCVAFQTLTKHWYLFCDSNARFSEGIPTVHAFTQSTWTKIREQPSIAKSAVIINDGWHKSTKLSGRWTRLHSTRTMGANSYNTTDSAAVHPKMNGRKLVVNTQVRSIMSILEERYELPFLQSNTTVTDPSRKTKEWKKTRNYLYHVSRSQSDSNDKSIAMNPTSIIPFEEQVVTVLDFLDDQLELPPAVSKRILQESPRILRKPVDSFLTPTADFLIKLWGRDMFVQAVERNPRLLLSSGVGYTTNHRKTNNPQATNNSVTIMTAMDEGATVTEQTVEEVLSTYAGFTSSQLKRLKQSAPFVFGLEASKAYSVLEFLDGILQQAEEKESQRKKIVGKLIFAHPNLLNLSVESNLKPRVTFLAESCDLDPSQIAKVVQTSNGSVLGLSVEQNLKPTLNYLLHEIFLPSNDGDDPKEMLKKCILTHPQLLGLSLSNLQSKTEYFDSIGSTLAVRIVRKCPAIYSLNLDQNIIPTIEFLAKIWGMDIGNAKAASKKTRKTKISNNDFVSMLFEYPNIITLSLETNLQPTMMFFNKTGYTSLDKDWRLTPSETMKNSSPSVAINRIRGRYIAASLYNRLLPRWHYCLSISSVSSSPQDSQLSQPLEKPPLHLLVMSSDETFCETMNFQLDSFLNFKQDAIPRLKFSSQFDTWLKTGKPIDI